MSDLKESVRLAVKESLQENLASNQEPVEQLDESLSLAVFAVLFTISVAVTDYALWRWLSVFAKNIRTDKLFNEFIEQYDKKKLVTKKFPELVKNLKNVKTANEVHKIDREVKSMVKELDRMSKNIDKFVDGYDLMYDKDGYRLRDPMMLNLDPRKEKVRLKKNIKDLMYGIKTSFEKEIADKRIDFAEE